MSSKSASPPLIKAWLNQRAACRGIGDKLQYDRGLPSACASVPRLELFYQDWVTIRREVDTLSPDLRSGNSCESVGHGGSNTQPWCNYAELHGSKHDGKSVRHRPNVRR